MILPVIFLLVSFLPTCQAVIVADFEDTINTNLSTGTGYEWCPEWESGVGFSNNNAFYQDADHYKSGSHSLRIYCNDTNISSWMYDVDLSGWRYLTEAHNAGYDRMSFYIWLPEAYPLAPASGEYGFRDHNFNVGTYTIYPSTSEPLVSHDNSGWAGTEGSDQIWNHPHFYHLFNIKGSQYATKCVMNEHPGAESDRDNYDPGANPTSVLQGERPGTWDYYNGLTRIYFQALPYDAPPSSAATLPYNVYLDKLELYATSEEENDANISQIACTYMGSGQFWLTWRGNPYYAISNPGSSSPDSYEVYYASVPLTNTNYSSVGTKVSGTFARTSDWAVTDFISSGQFSTGITSGTVYFAIKDISDGSTVVSKIDYPITTPPTTPTGLSVS